MRTQNFILFLTIALFCQSFSFSQNEEDNKSGSTNGFRYAAKGGFNLSKNFGDVDSDESFLPDFHVGAVIEIPTPLRVYIQVEPQLSRVGSSLKGKAARRFSLLDIPILTTIKSFNNWSVEAGPKIAIKVNEKQRNDFDTELIKSDRMRRITAGIVAGATYNFSDNLFGQFRANYTFGDVIKDDAGDSEGTSILLFQLSVGYWLN